MPDERTLVGAHSLIFAAVPPSNLTAEMAAAWQSLGTGERLRHDKLHLSIHAVALVEVLDPTLLDRARQVPSFLRTTPFALEFDRLQTFGGNPGSFALVLATEKASAELNAVAAELHAGCRSMGLAASRPVRGTPHVTLAYGPGIPEIRRLERPIRWSINESELIDSIQGQGRHVSLGRWPLPKDRQQSEFEF